VEGLTFKAVGEPLASDDRVLFSKTVWDADIAYGIAAPEHMHTEQDEVDYIDAVERTALFFLRTLQEQTPQEEIKSFKPHHQALFRGIDQLLAPIREGKHGVIKKDCLEDTREVIQKFAKRYNGSVDLALLTAVGENLLSAVRGESEILEHMLKENLLGRLYTEGRGFSTCNGYVAGFMRQISHKYPRTRILEIGAGTGGTTSSVLDAIGDAYVSYTYTDISAGFFERATERFAGAAHKMEFRTFNTEYSPSQQGFQEGSYDIIIAANVLHATRRLADTMHNVRSLLRPGGYLIAVEVTGSMLREPGLMGGLEGWWLGEEDGRFPSPGISSKGWDQVLHQTGFSGIDTIAYDMSDIARHNCSSFVTQAIDERLEVLRDPLARMDLVPEVSGPVLILGGQTLPVSKCIQRAQNLLRRWTPQIQIFTDLENLEKAQIDTTGAQVLYLAELDEPIFSQPLTPRKLESLQELLAAAQNVLWVTSGCRADNPQASMTIGIGRALAFELPHVRMQFLDFEKGTPWDAETMVQHLIRMIFLSSLPKEESRKILWSHEQEIVVAEGTTLVSRVITDEEANVQFNAGRRRLKRRVSPNEDVEISYTADRPSIVLPAKDWTLTEGHEVVDVTLSTPLFIGDGTSCFLAFGKCRSSGVPTIILSGSDKSTCHVSDDDLLELASDTVMDVQQLSAIASAILGQFCASLMPEHGTTLVFAPEQGVEEAVQRKAAKLGRKVMFVSTGTEVERRPGWLFIHPLERSRTLRVMFPEDTVALLHFSGKGSPPKKIIEALPKNCAVRMVNAAAEIHRRDCLAEACTAAPSLKWHPPEVTTIDRIEQQEPGLNPTRSVLDWRQRDCLSVTVPPLNTHGFFASDKTYLLVGMTGELGQSLCQFMIDCGARNIVLASRNPPTGYEKWFKCIDKTVDLQVKMVKMDVTSREQVHAVVSTIRETMPEIAGVANAALVLDDSLFVNTTVPAIEKQLRPKVNGTSYLDEEFSACDLDFFICFSSLGSVFGNTGQSIYHAANMFATSLVERRRRRGQAGSVIHVGMIVDAGYVARSTRSGANIEKHLRSQFYMPLAEKEFHHLILQGVLVGRPNSSNCRCSSGEVTLGIQRFVDDPGAPTRPQWYHDPQLSHMILPMSSSSQTSSPGSTGQKKELISMLEKASSVSEATDIYQKLFCIKIESLMKIPVASINTTAPLSNLGLDSLLAVEIRAWLLRDTRLDVPLFGILNRESVSSICAMAAQQLLEQRKTTTDEQSKIMTSKPSDLEVTATRWQVTSNGKEDSSDDTTSTHTTTTVDAGLPLPASPPMTPPEPAQDYMVDKHIEELAPTADSPLPSPQSNGITLPASGLSGAEDAPILEHVERMSYSQASMHFLHNFLDDATTFNVVAHYNVNGPLSAPRFQRALEKAMARHDMYRTHFSADAGGLEPRQRIAAKTTGGNSLPRLVHMPSASTSQIQSVFEDLSQRKWQLERGEAFLCVLLAHDNSESESESECNTILFGCHHIIMDGMSWHVFLNDLDRAYRLLPLEAVPFTYADFSRRQLEEIQNGQLDESLAFWMRKLDPVPGVIPLLPLSHRRNRKVSRVYKNHTVQKELMPQTNHQIKSAAQGYRATPMQLCLVAWQILMMKLLDLDDDELCIGITDAGRGTSGHFGETVGHFTNLLPMKFLMGKEMTMAEVVSKTSQIVTEGYEHAQVPLNLIFDRLQIQRSMAYTPLFQIAFNYRIGDLLNRQLGNCQMDLVAYRDARTPYDLTLNVTQSSSGSQLVEITSNTHLYTRDATQRLLDMYTDLLDTLSSVDKSTRWCDLKLLSSSDAACQDVSGSRYLKSERTWPKTLTERLQQVWTEYPNSPAVKDDAASLTYEELRVRVQDIVRVLRRASICPGMM
jgi:SAM-dependent methyltransferase/NAD(P)-dependent dehydrogenase (short-subunit alcohol dehydrogenase family)